MPFSSAGTSRTGAVGLSATAPSSLGGKAVVTELCPAGGRNPVPAVIASPLGKPARLADSAQASKFQAGGARRRTCRGSGEQDDLRSALEQGGEPVLTVTDFSSRKFPSILIEAPRLNDLDSAVDRFGGEPFVLATGPGRRAAFVHPGLYADLRQSSRLQGHELADACGVLDALAVGQLTVDHRASAVTVAAIAKTVHASVAVGVTEYGEAVGVFVPSWLVEVLPSTSVVVSAGLSEHVQHLLTLDGDLSNALALVEERLGDFHSERVNLTRPRPLECKWRGGHLVARCPCQVHSGAPCARLAGDP